MSFIPLEDRTFLTVKGPEARSFLQGLVTNDLEFLRPENPCIYTALLTPQGKFLHDFFIFKKEDAYILTPEKSRAEDLLKRLKMYKLRKKVELEDGPQETSLFYTLSLPPKEAFFVKDPRREDLGYIGIACQKDPLFQTFEISNFKEYDRYRILKGLPNGSRDLTPEKSIILENNFDDHKGISFDKGCYLGQELMARTKFRGEIRKKLLPFKSSTDLPLESSSILLGDKVIGKIKSISGPYCLALVRINSIGSNSSFSTDQGHAIHLLHTHV